MSTLVAVVAESAMFSWRPLSCGSLIVDNDTCAEEIDSVSVMASNENTEEGNHVTSRCAVENTEEVVTGPQSTASGKYYYFGLQFACYMYKFSYSYLGPKLEGIAADTQSPSSHIEQ